jgi:hypothetical protein
MGRITSEALTGILIGFMACNWCPLNRSQDGVCMALLKYNHYLFRT